MLTGIIDKVKDGINTLRNLKPQQGDSPMSDPAADVTGDQKPAPADTVETIEKEAEELTPEQFKAEFATWAKNAPTSELVLMLDGIKAELLTRAPLTSDGPTEEQVAGLKAAAAGQALSHDEATQAIKTVTAEDIALMNKQAAPAATVKALAGKPTAEDKAAKQAAAKAEDDRKKAAAAYAESC